MRYISTNFEGSSTRNEQLNQGLLGLTVCATALAASRWVISKNLDTWYPNHATTRQRIYKELIGLGASALLSTHTTCGLFPDILKKSVNLIFQASHPKEENQPRVTRAITGAGAIIPLK